MARDRPRVGDEARLEVTVGEDMLVDILGRRIHPVYATAWMVKHMEDAGRMLIEPHLQPGEDATGYSISVTHERPARVGDRLIVVARATRIDDRECEATVEVRGADGRVGHGTLVQRYIEAGRLAERSTP
ncbi:MAG TPA: hotdog domain-containing protein [Actinomycetota bacterium]|nr:hotdog domain-containing protein [Actinomycetota bacterium]